MSINQSRPTITLRKPAQPQQPQPAARPQQLPNPSKEQPKQHPMNLFVGKRVILQTRTCRYQGVLRVITSNWLIMRDVTVAGTKTTVTLPEIYISTRTDIVHAHLAEGVIVVTEAAHEEVAPTANEP